MGDKGFSEKNFKQMKERMEIDKQEKIKAEAEEEGEPDDGVPGGGDRKKRERRQ